MSQKYFQNPKTKQHHYLVKAGYLSCRSGKQVKLKYTQIKQTNKINAENQKTHLTLLFYIYPPSIAPLLSESRILILQIPKTKLKIQYTQIKQINRINTETQNPYLTLLFYIYPPPIAPLLSESKMLCLDYPLKLTKLPKCP